MERRKLEERWKGLCWDYSLKQTLFNEIELHVLLLYVSAKR